MDTRWLVRRSLTVGFFLAFAPLATLPGAPAGAEEGRPALLPRRSATKAAYAGTHAGQSPDAIEIKFAQGTDLRLREGRLVSLEGEAPAGVQAALLIHPVREIERLFSQPEEHIASERGVLEVAGGPELPDLNLWYRIHVAPRTDAGALVEALNALPEVEIAYLAPLPAPPPGMPGGNPAGTAAVPAPDIFREAATPDFSWRQGYAKAAPGGINAACVWSLAGGSGQRARIVDIEYSFNPDHEDLPAIPVIAGAVYQAYGSDHGTAVVGELAGADNGYGIRGIAFRSPVSFVSPCGDASFCYSYNPAQAVNAARLATAPGDVILLEQQTLVCGYGKDEYGPIEWIPSVHDAIAVATAARRIVVEAAGNGGVDLDASACAGAFDRATRDSGAIIVGAGAPPGYSQADRSRLYFSSYGSRLDLQGWGVYVVTTGYGNLHAGAGPSEWYTDSFSGTSSATPIVAGAAALLSSISRQRGLVQAPARIRSLLAATGSPQQDSPGYPASQRIGPRPNLKKALSELERPRTLSPAGAVADRTPTYRWTQVPGAAKYRLEVYRGGARLFSAAATAAACAAGACSATPPRALASGAHSWRAQAFVGDWKSWSAPRSFTVAP